MPPRVLKLLAGVVGCMLLCMLVLVTCTGGLLGHVAKQSATSVLTGGIDQSISTDASGVTITTSLQPVKQVVLSGVKLCSPFPRLTHRYVCANQQCESILDYPSSPLPKDLPLHREYGGRCYPQTIPNIDAYAVTSYRGVIGITRELATQLRIVKTGLTITRTANSRFRGYDIAGMNDTARVTLEYRGTAPAQDEFLVGGQVVKVIYK